MVDIHFHGLPCVDDGPDTEEVSIQLIRQAYQKGTREIVLTPHMHHPMSFGCIPFNEQEKSQTYIFQSFFDQVKLVLPNLILHEGAEIYISRKHQGQLNQMKIKTLGHTDYILVEFSRQINYHQMDTLLYELYLLGYRPIIAHLEEYPTVCNKIENIKALYRDNYLIQVNAGNIVNNKTEYGKRVKQLIELGLVDVVASDTHNLNSRLPKMAQARRYIRKTYGRKIAKLLFVENPSRIINNQPAVKDYKVNNTKQRFILGLTSTLLLAFMATSVLARKLDIAVSSALGLEITDESKYPKLESANSESKTISKAETFTKDNLRGKESTGQTMPDEVLLPEIQQEDKNIDSQENDLTHEEKLIEFYTSYLTLLQESYLQAIDVYYIELQQSVEIEQEEKAKRILDEIASLESQANNKVYKTLYDMQNDLESYEYDVEIVHRARQYYLDMKAKVAQEYENKLILTNDDNRIIKN